MADSRELEGRIAVVTGASRGIGRRVAVRLAERGARVAIAARTATTRADNLGGLDATARLIAATGSVAIPLQVDLMQPGEAERLVHELNRQLGDVDILVNVAAKLDPLMYGTFDQMTPGEFRAEFELNLFAPFVLIKGLWAGMKRRGGGRVINFTSRAAQFQEAGKAKTPGKGGTGVGYTTTKAAVNRMTNAIANELLQDGIAVVALDPGSTTTENRLRIAERFGFSPEGTHDADLPARAAAYLAYCPEPMRYAGRVIVARDLVAELRL